MAGKDQIAGIPLIRILDRVGLDVPAVAIPVHLDSEEDVLFVLGTSRYTAHRNFSGLYLIRDLEVRQFRAPIIVFFEEVLSAPAPSVPDTTPGIKFLKTFRKSRSRP